MRSILYTLFLFLFTLTSATAQSAGDCPYPILLLHGWNSNETAFAPLYNNTDFKNIWGPLSDIFDAVVNATSSTNIWGADGLPNTPDDDVLVQFVNKSNTLAPGCIYVDNFENFWNQNAANPTLDPNGDWPSNSNQSDSNEAASKKRGYAVGKAIAKVLAANPNKDKVIVAGHSMGGVDIREYLQRVENGTHLWWQPDGQHHVAKVITLGSPHRGSNSFGNPAPPPMPNHDAPTGDFRNTNPDLYSEGIRDLRYSYACGFASLSNCRSLYLYGGDEAAQGSFYWNNDVDCDGDGTSTNVVGMNVAGTVNAWDGTNENPAIPLPGDVHYTYFVTNYFNIGCSAPPAPFQYAGCGGDGIVDDERQWIYTGGDGKTNSYYNGNSVPSPSDGVNYRLSDRVTSTNRVNHGGQTADFNFVMKCFDEPDYAEFAYTVTGGRGYAGVAQIRPDKVPMNSEYTNTGSIYVDGDWYKYTTSGGTGLQINLTPRPNVAVRLDLYTTTPSAYSNANATLSMSKTAAANTAGTYLSVQSPINLPAGTYYFRITHDVSGLATPLESWKIPYTFNVSEIVVLPLELLNFQAKKEKNTINVSWNINNNKQLKAFVLEKAVDAIHFFPLETLDLTSKSNEYNYLDKNPTIGDNFYRLKMEDLDGKVTYSTTIQTPFQRSGLFIKNLYPNPFEETLLVQCHSDQEDAIHLRLFDYYGRVVAQADYEGNTGTQLLRLATAPLPSGVYLLEITQGGSSQLINVLKK
jgi:Secretion system C-terminal sorting domain